MATANFSIKPQDGWVQITDIASVGAIRVRQYPRTQPFYITSSSSAPAVTDRGYLVDCEDFWCEVATTDDYYVRVTSPRGDTPLRIDVFTLAPAA